MISSSLFDTFLFCHSTFSILLYCSITVCLASFFQCLVSLLFCGSSSLLWSFIWHVMRFKFFLFIPSLFTSLSQFYEQEQIVRSVIVMPYALQYPSNISIPLSLSGHWQISHHHRSHSQTFPSHSQTFHTDILHFHGNLYHAATLIGSLNIKLDKSCKVFRTSLMYPTLLQEVTTNLCTMLLEKALFIFSIIQY